MDHDFLFRRGFIHYIHLAFSLIISLLHNVPQVDGVYLIPPQGTVTPIDVMKPFFEKAFDLGVKRFVFLSALRACLFHCSWGLVQMFVLMCYANYVHVHVAQCIGGSKGQHSLKGFGATRACVHSTNSESEICRLNAWSSSFTLAKSFHAKIWLSAGGHLVSKQKHGVFLDITYRVAHFTFVTRDILRQIFIPCHTLRIVPHITIESHIILNHTLYTYCVTQTIILYRK